MADEAPDRDLEQLAGRTPGRKVREPPIAICPDLARDTAGSENGECESVARRARGEAAGLAFATGQRRPKCALCFIVPKGRRSMRSSDATGWQAHTVRGFISRTLRKQGRRVRSFRKDGERVYRLKP